MKSRKTQIQAGAYTKLQFSHKQAMKTLPSISILNDHLGHQRTSTVLTSNSSVLILNDVHDHEVLHLPPIHIGEKRAPASCRPTKQGPLSSNKPDYVLMISDEVGTRSRNLLDIREESFDSDQIPSLASHRKIHVRRGRVENPSPELNTLCPPPSDTKVLASRLDAGGEARQSNTTQGRKLNPVQHLLPLQQPPSNGQNSAHTERGHHLPSIHVNGKAVPSRSSSSPSVTIHHAKLPSIRRKSGSQPNISTLVPTSTLLSTESPCSPAKAKRQRLRNLWRVAGQKLGLSEDITGHDDFTWVQGPGDFLRPVYARWEQRRHALAEPEKMCMRQEVREQIQKEVELRRRSVKRKGVAVPHRQTRA